MKGIEQNLQGLFRRRGFRSLLQPALESNKRAIDGGTVLLDLFAEFEERSAHSHDGGVDVDELGAEVDEVGVVAVDEVDELVVERSAVRLELGSECVEGDEGAELRNVGLGVEVRGEEERGLEPERVRVQRVREEVRRGSRWRLCRNRIRHFGSRFCFFFFGFFDFVCCVWLVRKNREKIGFLSKTNETENYTIQNVLIGDEEI